jgi:Bacterial type II/III secretion system short domain
MRSAGSSVRMPLLATGLVLAFLAGDTAAAGEPTGKPKEQRLAFVHNQTPWPRVFEWLSDKTGLPFIASDKGPAGTFTFVPAKIGDRQRLYTVPEIIDTVNEALGPKGYLLVRRERSLTLVAMDEKVQPSLVPLVPLNELPSRGRTELVRIILPLAGMNARDAAATAKTLLGPFGEITPLTNHLVLRDTAGNLAQILEVLKQVGMKGSAPSRKPTVAGDTPVLKSFSVPEGQAAEIATAFQKIYADNPRVKVMALGGNQVIVWAGAEELLAIARHIEGRFPPAVIERIPLTVLDAQKTAETLRAMFGKASLFVESEPRGNKLILRGSREQIGEVREALRALGETPPKQGGGVRIVPLPEGNAVVLAEALQKLLTQMRSNPVRIITPGQKAPPPPKQPARGAGKVAAPITITPLGNRLILSSTDAEALALAQELVRLFTSSQDRTLEVIRLRYARPADVAKVLDETFNGPSRSARSGVPERIRIVPDPARNALLVKARPLDLLTIRRLLSTSLDVETPETAGSMRVHVIPLRNARAVEVAQILREVFGEGKRKPDVPADPASLSIGVDTRTNSLVIRCTPMLEQEIEALVQRLDQKETPKKETPK